MGRTSAGISIFVSCRTATIYLYWRLQPRFPTWRCPTLRTTCISARHSLPILHAGESTLELAHPSDAALSTQPLFRFPPSSLNHGRFCWVMRRHSGPHVLCRFLVAFMPSCTRYPCTVHILRNYHGLSYWGCHAEQ